jgi:hypothetical protein
MDASVDAIGIKDETHSKRLSQLEFEVLRETVVRYLLCQSDLDQWYVSPEQLYGSIKRETALDLVTDLLSAPTQQINESEPLTWETFVRAQKLMKLAEARDILSKLYRGLLD